VLAPEVILAQTGQPTRFGKEGCTVVLKPGVEIRSTDVTQWFNPAQFNPAHIKYIARSEKAKPTAVHLYSNIWTFLVCVTVTVLVSLFTKPKSDAELKNLVMGLTPRPDERSYPWHERPMLWAAVVFVVLVTINVVFW